MNVRFGKIGANGQTTVKEFSSASEASEAAEKLIKEKTKKGYVEK
jgi:predicted DNA-binding WGR domain protein